MDNLAHGLLGAALGEAGLKKKTGLGLATLIIAANIPDIDALGLLFGENLAWRRGWTHGPVAWVVLPLLLTGVMILFDRWQGWRGKRPLNRLPVRPGWLLGLSVIGVLSHPLLDFLNTYGIRCLMPFSDRWFYGDTLFIIDLWVWLGLGLGVWFSRRRARRGEVAVYRPARVALGVVTAYTLAMGLGSEMAVRVAEKDVVAQGFAAPTKIVASPVPVDPFRRRIVVESDESYGYGEVRWAWSPKFELEPEWQPTNMTDPRILRAAETDKDFADFLYWSRFPFARITEDAGGTRIMLGDARYARGTGGSSFTVETVLGP